MFVLETSKEISSKQINGIFIATELLKTHKCAGKENTPFIDNCLPKESFVLFDAYKLKGSEIVWINKELIQEYEIELDEESIKSELIENFSYVSNGYTKKTRIMY